MVERQNGILHEIRRAVRFRQYRKIDMAVRKKEIIEKARRYYNALNEGAKGVKFKGYSEVELKAEIDGLETDMEQRDALIAQTKLLEEKIDNRCIKIDDMCLDIRNGIEGHEDYGDDSELYATAGHIRKSERKTGKTNKTPAGSGDNT